MDRGQPAATSASGLKVFISYSREDLSFVDELELVLSDKGHEVLIDRHGISAGEEFEKRLEQMIRTCDTAVFVMTDDSLTSDACNWEVDLTKNKYAKRLLVVTPAEVSKDVKIPDELAGIDWIHCWRNPRVKDSNPTKGFIELDRALRLDLAWVRQESDLYDDALKWIDAGSKLDSPLLLTGDLLTSAQNWARKAPDGHSVTDQVDQYIKASAKAEAQRQAEIAADIAEREKAVEEARLANELRESANARAQRRTYGLVGLSGLLIAGAIGGIIYFQNLRADVLEEQDKTKIAKRENAISRAQVIAEAATFQLEAGDVESATRLAILAYQEGKEAGGVASANVALSLIAQEKRATAFLSGHESPVKKYVPASWDNLSLTLTTLGTIRIWDGLEKVGEFPRNERFVDVIFNKELQQIVTLGSNGVVRTWSFDLETGVREERTVTLPEQKPTALDDGPDPEIRTKEVRDFATQLIAMPNGGFIAETQFRNAWLFGPVGDGSFASREVNLVGDKSIDYAVEELSVTIGTLSDVSGYPDIIVNYETNVFRDGAWQVSQSDVTVDANTFSVGKIDHTYPAQASIRSKLGNEIPVSNSVKKNLNAALDRANYIESPDGKYAAAWMGSKVFFISEENGKVRRIDTSPTGPIRQIAITSDNAYVAVWSEEAPYIALYSPEKAASFDELIWHPISFDLDNPVYESEALNTKLHLGEGRRLLVIDRTTEAVTAGPLQLPRNSDLAAYTFADDGRVVVTRDLADNFLVFDSQSGVRLKTSGLPPDELKISQTRDERIGKIADELCARLRLTPNRAHLTSADANAVVLLKNHNEADVCAGPLGAPIKTLASAFGKGSLQSAFSRALEFVLKWEGGFVDDPDDPGGRTNKGTTQKLYDKWRASKGLPSEDVLHIIDEEVHQIYLQYYWNNVVQNWYPDDLSIVLFDSAANMGPRRAISMLQHSINEVRTGPNIAVDGAASEQLYLALREVISSGAEDALLEAYISTRRGVYYGIVDRHPRRAKFLNGWLNRLNDLAKYVGVSDSEFE